MEWECKAQFEAGGGDRVGLLALDSGHWGVVWAYAPTHGMQLVSYDPERAREVFEVTRNRYEGREGLSFDSRTAWQSGSI
ncbi:hypothetical protein ACFWB2_14560 [Streptomyces virginiae]|uniref:hypothetical protein n=1 Tax=Streptomyces TaxID=1883 RepID=UPI00093AF2A1|nr:hypothetical protein [Streptomyces sp. MJM1172]OKI67549.1 hypothetical protein AMK15_06115 [Streptomyces sp. MJM1172]